MKFHVWKSLAALAIAVTLSSCAGIRGTSTSGGGNNQSGNPGTPGNPDQPGSSTRQTAYSGVAVATWHFDNARSGLNSHEATLSPSNVNVSTFGKLFSYEVDGYVYAQPLYVSNVPIAGGIHNVVYVATEYDTVYAFDADTPGNGSPLWKTSLLRSGETPEAGGNPKPWIGITSTPAIDVGGKTMFVVSAHAGGLRRLNAVDIETGAVRGSVDISASVPSTLAEAVNGQLQLSSGCLQRAALLLTQGTVFIGFGGCAHGWLLAYDAGSLKQTAAFSSSPNMDGYGPYPGGGGIWGAGAGPASDDQGNIFVVTGDGPNDGSQTSWGQSVLRLNLQLQVQDYFTPADAAFLQCKDNDLGSAGVVLMPGTNQLISGGKNGKMFVLNTGSLGHQSTNDSGAASGTWYNDSTYTDTCNNKPGTVMTGTVGDYRIYGTVAWYNGSVYVGADPGPVKRFVRDGNGSLTLMSQAPAAFARGSLGTTPFISSNGASNGIVWAIDHGVPIGGGTATPAVLHAYDANDLSHELYNSTQNVSDSAGLAVKFTSPIVANGKAFVGAGHDDLGGANPTGELDVYGLLPHSR
jgi:hypothetical protein